MTQACSRHTRSQGGLVGGGGVGEGVHTAAWQQEQHPRDAVISLVARPSFLCVLATASDVMCPCGSEASSSLQCTAQLLSCKVPANHLESSCIKKNKLHAALRRGVVPDAGLAGSHAGQVHQNWAFSALHSTGMPWLGLHDPHLGQYVAHDLAVIVLRHVQQLLPGEDVIEVVLQQQAVAQQECYQGRT